MRRFDGRDRNVSGMIKKLTMGLAGLGLGLTAFAHGVHEHGVARLQVAIDGGRLVVALQSPLDNLVGFEHKPRTAAQRSAWAEAEGRLRDFGALFVLPPAAGCTLTNVDLELPWEAGARPDYDHDHDHDHDAAHGEVHVQYALDCAQPQALTGLTVKLAERFPRTARIRAEAVTPRGQNAQTLTRDKNTLAL
ncbi:DUF2796 domain-containing protein [Zoogloeaceae bacteirum Par-f-2]|nr:DUF2796 domain-containing protein [Zoogloeaceae bacteirum Par-f-2]